MKVKLDTDVCIGFANCEQTCPKIFKVVSGISTVQVDEIEPADVACVENAANECPSGAITLEK